MPITISSIRIIVKLFVIAALMTLQFDYSHHDNFLYSINISIIGAYACPDDVSDCIVVTQKVKVRLMPKNSVLLMRYSKKTNVLILPMAYSLPQLLDV